jgi:hypothetical protein
VLQELEPLPLEPHPEALESLEASLPEALLL